MKIIDVHGKPEEMGLAIGREARLLVHDQLALYKKHWKELTGVGWTESLERVRAYEESARVHAPRACAELAGIAAGAGVSARELFLLNSYEEIEAMHDVGEKRAKRGKCTSVALLGPHMHDGRARIGHNEDWVWFDTDFLYVVRAKPDRGPAFLSVTYGGLLPNYGVNEHGLAQVCDSLAATDERVGVPRLLVCREVLGSARSIDDAAKIIRNMPRAGGYNHLLMDARGRAVNLETTATKEVLRPVHDFSAHTNFYQDGTLDAMSLHTATYSRYRYYRVSELLRGLVRSDAGATVSSMFDVLSDHQNYPESVCRHRSDRADDHDQTIVSYIIDPARRTISVRPGNPCGKTTRKKVTTPIYSLDMGDELWR